MIRKLVVVLLLGAASWPLGAAAAGNLVVPTPADLPLNGFGDGFELAGPRLVGDSVVWATQTTSGAFHLRAADGNGVRELATLPPTGADNSASIDLEASPTRLVMAERSTNCQEAGHSCIPLSVADAALTGPLGSQPQFLAGCGSGGPPCSGVPCSYPARFAVDIAGDAVAISDRCQDGQLRVIDYSSGAPVTTTTLPGEDSVRIAGRYLAWVERTGTTEPGPIVVYDRIDGREIYRVAARVLSLALQDDGKVAFIEQSMRDAPSQAAWASPLEPFPHPLPVTTTYLEVRIGADRVATASIAPARATIFTVLDLAGRTVASVENESPIGGWDFDGTRLGFASQPCVSAYLLVWDLATPVPPTAPAGGCPAARTVDRSLTLRPGRPIKLRLACPAQPALGCAGHIRLIADTRRPHSGPDGVRGMTVIGNPDYRLDPGASGSTSLKPNPEVTGLVRRHRSLRLIATSIASPRDGQGASGPFEVRTTIIRARVRR